MAKISILVEGYVRDEGETVQGTVTLVQDNDHNIIVDPGMTHDPRARHLPPVVVRGQRR